MTAAQEPLARVRVTDLMTRWRPGSYDHTWEDEARDLATRTCCCREGCGPPTTCLRLPGAYQAGVVERIQREGIGYADAFAPVLAGNDGRLWDGHHRVVAAQQLGIEWINVDIAEPEDTE